MIESSQRISDVLRSYHSRISRALESFDLMQVSTLVDVLHAARKNGRTVFVAGNGGSASTSGHFVIDWAYGSGLSNPPLRVVSLADSSPAITATGNDQSFERVFLRQLETHGKPGDLLIMISASGNSPNLLTLLPFCKAHEIQIIAMTGFDGGELKRNADISIHVETELGDYGVAEDLHLMIGHITKEALIVSATGSD
jgi:D-sedoheptulose 7-phosphate isomerase